MKPVTLLYVFVSFFGPDRAQRPIAFLSLLNLLTNRNIAFIYSVTICELKTKDCTDGQEASNINYGAAPLFSTLMFAGFHNQSPLLTMIP